MIEQLENRSFFSAWWTPAMHDQLSKSIDQRLIPGASVEMFSAGDYARGTGYVRNPNYWAGNLTLAESVWNSAGGQRMSGTLVTPQDILFANHYAYGAGTVVRWIDANNNVVDRTVVGTQSLPDCDTVVAHLDRPIDPSAIPFVQIMDSPETLADAVGSSYVPVIVDNQFNQSLVYNMQPLAFGFGNLGVAVEPGIIDAEYQRKQFSSTIISGDSGDPMFLVFNNRPILVEHVTFGTTSGTQTSGYSYTYNRAAIDAGLAALGSPYHLTAFNPADFNSDGVVDSMDFSILAMSFNTQKLPDTSGANVATLFSNADVNMDGVVNALDFNALATEYGAGA